MTKKISLYIPVFNGSRYLAETLEAVSLQTVKPDEIIVVNDGSTDESRQIALRFGARVVSHEKRRGLGAARNTGVNVSDSEFVASVDADCPPGRNWLENCIRCFEDDEISGVGGQVREMYTQTAADKWRSVHLKQNDYPYQQEVSFLAGANTVFRKDDLLSVGGYDESFTTNHEDMDISRRLTAAGKRLLFTNKAQVMHIRRDNVFSVMRTCWAYRNRAAFSNWNGLFFAIIRDICKSAKLFMLDLCSRRFSLLMIDICFCVLQPCFSVMSFKGKNKV